ncbi:hypothetical protein LTR84_008263 [Exophiala bonariae]|uniref:Uncharacterized protein n=1 Tax=Exophiala bonariae TaxID=1690606 RepID=A0AAV9N0W4_9EURO|nr:hypothetical protein LTR84_008263 [Exophiala bonariae]
MFPNQQLMREASTSGQMTLKPNIAKIVAAMPESVDVIVEGAGLSGLSGAGAGSHYRFTDADVKEIGVFYNHIDDIGRELDLADPSALTNPAELDTLTQGEYCNKTFGRDSIAAVTANALTRAPLGTESSELSVLFFVGYCWSGCGLHSLTSDGRGGGQSLRARQDDLQVTRDRAEAWCGATVDTWLQDLLRRIRKVHRHLYLHGNDLPFQKGHSIMSDADVQQDRTLTFPARHEHKIV